MADFCYSGLRGFHIEVMVANPMADALFVLDSSAFLAGKTLSSFKPMITTESVREELLRLGEEKRLSSYPELEYDAPSRGDIENVEKLAKTTGDEKRLSPVDIELVALSLKHEATMVSDDYSIQNICKEAGISFLALSEQGIKEKVVWVLRCRGCGRYVEKESRKRKAEGCPVCGSELRSVRKRSTRI